MYGDDIVFNHCSWLVFIQLCEELRGDFRMILKKFYFDIAFKILSSFKTISRKST